MARSGGSQGPTQWAVLGDAKALGSDLGSLGESNLGSERS